MRARTPDFETTTQRSLKEVTECVGLYWQGTTLPIPGGMSFTQDHGPLMPLTDLTIDVTDEGNQRRARLYRRTASGFSTDKTKELSKLSQCLEPSR
jgi:hypothetical protein